MKIFNLFGPERFDSVKDMISYVPIFGTNSSLNLTANSNSGTQRRIRRPALEFVLPFAYMAESDVGDIELSPLPGVAVTPTATGGQVGASELVAGLFYPTTVETSELYHPATERQVDASELVAGLFYPTTVETSELHRPTTERQVERSELVVGRC